MTVETTFILTVIQSIYQFSWFMKVHSFIMLNIGNELIMQRRFCLAL